MPMPRTPTGATRILQGIGLLILVPVLLLAACSEQAPPVPRPDRPAPTVLGHDDADALSGEQIRLRATLNWLGASFRGKAGIAVRDLRTGWTTGYDERAWMPQQSVSKLWVALAALDRADRGEFDLGADVVVGRDDLTVFYQPIRKQAWLPGGFTTTHEDLLRRALSESDNTANDVLLRHVGGSGAIRETLAGKGLTGIRFGPGERLLQSSIAGLEWRPEYSLGKAFFHARDDVPDRVRRKAFEAYLADPVDGASAGAIVAALARLHAGELLSAASTRKLLDILSHTKSGPKRLKGGLPEGWRIAHKTGTGQVLDKVHSAYNDVGILTAPSGRSYAVAILIGRTAMPVPERMEFMHRIVGAIVEYEAGVSAGAKAGGLSPDP